MTGYLKFRELSNTFSILTIFSPLSNDVFYLLVKFLCCIIFVGSCNELTLDIYTYMCPNNLLKKGKNEHINLSLKSRGLIM